MVDIVDQSLLGIASVGNVNRYISSVWINSFFRHHFLTWCKARNIRNIAEFTPWWSSPVRVSNIASFVHYPSSGNRCFLLGRLHFPRWQVTINCSGNRSAFRNWSQNDNTGSDRLFNRSDKLVGVSLVAQVQSLANVTCQVNVLSWNNNWELVGRSRLSQGVLLHLDTLDRWPVSYLIFSQPSNIFFSIAVQIQPTGWVVDLCVSIGSRYRTSQIYITFSWQVGVDADIGQITLGQILWGDLELHVLNTSREGLTGVLESSVQVTFAHSPHGEFFTWCQNGQAELVGWNTVSPDIRRIAFSVFRLIEGIVVDRGHVHHLRRGSDKEVALISPWQSIIADICDNRVVVVTDIVLVVRVAIVQLNNLVCPVIDVESWNGRVTVEFWGSIIVDSILWQNNVNYWFIQVFILHNTHVLVAEDSQLLAFACKAGTATFIDAEAAHVLRDNGLRYFLSRAF